MVETRFLLTRAARRRLIASRLAVGRSADGDLVKASSLESSGQALERFL